MITPYITPQGVCEASITEKKSVFIARLSPADTEQAALAVLEAVRAAHRTANHNVYAYSLCLQNRCRYSDDGEPAKTAGLPVLSAIQHAGLQNCIIVVTRYFGGTLLGTGGLVRAYGKAAAAAIEKCGKACVRAVRDIELTLPYRAYDEALRLIKDSGARMEPPVFGKDVRLCLTLPSEDAQPLLLVLRELLRGGDGILPREERAAVW